MRWRTIVAGALVATLAGTASGLRAQDRPLADCEGRPVDPSTCQRVALGAEALIPVIAVSAAGGSPVSGTASTLGMRLTSMPRWSMSGRLTWGRARAPDLVAADADGMTVMPLAVTINGSVGLLPGLNPLPTIGGVASFDLLLSAGWVPIVASDGYGGSGGWTWAAGGRLGLLRESFTLPGVSVSGMYRQLRDIRLGDEDLERTGTRIAGDFGMLSARVAASKAVLLINLTGGVGYDVIYGDIDYAWTPGVEAGFTSADRRMERLTVFGELSYTLMVMHMVIGGGWQEAPPESGDPVLDDQVGAGLYGTATLRISI